MTSTIRLAPRAINCPNVLMSLVLRKLVPSRTPLIVVPHSYQCRHRTKTMINNLFPTHFSKTFEVVIKMPTNCLPWEAILINVSTQLARRSYCGVDWALERNNLSESFVDSMEWRWNAAAYFFSQRVNIEDYAESLVHRVVLSFFILCSSKRNESFKNTWQCLKTSELISLVKILPVLSCTASLPRTRKKRTTKLA